MWGRWNDIRVMKFFSIVWGLLAITFAMAEEEFVAPAAVSSGMLDSLPEIPQNFYAEYEHIPPPVSRIGGAR